MAPLQDRPSGSAPLTRILGALRALEAQKVLQAFLVRAFPALGSLASLALVAEILNADQFGLYSTILASVGVAGNILFGPIVNGIVSQYHVLGKKFGSRHTEANLVSMVFLIALLFVISAFLSGEFLIVLLALLSGVLLVFQEILRARFRLLGYGLAASASTWGSFVLFLAFLPEHSSAEAGLKLYGASLALAVLISFAALGFPRPARPRKEILKDPLLVGINYTFSGGLEQTFSLAMRYLVLMFGSPETLAAFSLCLDLAQRLVTFVISCTSFVFVPLAFKRAAATADTQFLRTIHIGTFVSTLTALSVIGGVLLLASTDLVPLLSNGIFRPYLFAVIGTSVMINRIGKGFIDPPAAREQLTRLIPLAYGITLPVFLLGAWAVARLTPIFHPELWLLGGAVVSKGLAMIILTKAGVNYFRGYDGRTAT